MTNAQMANITAAVQTLSEMPNLTENQSEIVDKAFSTIEELKAEKRAQNERMRKYINKRRQTDKNYCR